MCVRGKLRGCGREACCGTGRACSREKPRGKLRGCGRELMWLCGDENAQGTAGLLLAFEGG